MRNKSAVKIQACYRGFRKRKFMNRIKSMYNPKRKPKFLPTQMNMHDDLCRMFALLKVKPILGLNLEPRSKTLRRKARFEDAAAFRLQRFFKMILQKKLAQRILALKREQRIDRSARIITRCIRYMRTKKFVKRCIETKRRKKALQLQCCFRAFQAKNRYYNDNHCLFKQVKCVLCSCMAGSTPSERRKFKDFAVTKLQSLFNATSPQNTWPLQFIELVCSH